MLTEARELYVHGFFYSCVIMAAVTAERILKDLLLSSIRIVADGEILPKREGISKALESFGANEIRVLLKEAEILEKELDKALSCLASKRNKYAHANLSDLEPESDALEAIKHLDQVVEGTVSIFHEFSIQHGKLAPKKKDE